MKIIQNNQPFSRFTFPFEVKCDRCKSLLEAEDGDVKSGTSGQPQEDNAKNYFYVVCPVCQNWQPVKPPHLKR